MIRKLIWTVVPLMATSPAALAVGRAAERVVMVADSRGHSNFMAWWIDLYNESHLFFAIATIVTIPSMALVLGKITGMIMARTGINLRSRELAEH